MTPEERDQTLQLAVEAASFVAHPFWARWLDFGEKLADRRLGELRDCQSSDADLVRNLRDRWRITEEVFELLQLYPRSLIEAGKEAQQVVPE